MKPGPKPLMPRVFYQTRWTHQHVRSGKCRSCHRSRDRRDRVLCRRCRRLACVRAAVRYRAQVQG